MSFEKVLLFELVKAVSVLARLTKALFIYFIDASDFPEDGSIILFLIGRWPFP